MCGITGFIGKGDERILREMADTLVHRGPDSDGFFFAKTKKGGSVGLGFRRLAIIDTTTGNQPIYNEDRTIAVIFNGEIYNFREIRKELEIRGHSFRTNTDTEVIAHLYEEDGIGCFRKMNGMFAIAIWDSREEKLVLARDRIGKKPLYYYFDGEQLIFGSELKAILKHPSFRKDLDYQSISQYFLFDHIPTPRTAFKRTFKLLPGSHLEYSNGSLKIERFWDISFLEKKGPKVDSSFKNEQKLISGLGDMLESAVSKRMVADVPLGIFLSGGIDSSAVAYYAQKTSEKKIKTFSIGFEDKTYDESAYAQQVARYLGTEHYHETLSSARTLDLIPRIADFLDEPLADASIIATFLLSRFAREQVTVALGGDGGDELLIGYPTFKAYDIAGYLKWLPLYGVRLASHMAGLLPVSHSYLSTDYKLKRFLKGLSFKPEFRNQVWLGTFIKSEQERLFSAQVWEMIKSKDPFEPIDLELSGREDESEVNRIIRLYQRHYLMDQVLVKVDRASMAASLEVRAPFLDYEMVDFCNNIPYNIKAKKGVPKYLLKRLMEGKIPENIIKRPKKGFGVPLGVWFRKELKDFTSDLLLGRSSTASDMFDHKEIETILQEHWDKKCDRRKEIWSLVVFYLWMEKWG